MANGNDLGGGDLAVSPDLAPGSVENQLAFGQQGQAPAAAAPTRPRIDMALGDSIAVQQYKHGIGGLGTPKQYNARNPDPIDWNSNKYTGEVGAPPTRILARIRDMLTKDPDAVRGKNIELMIGSNQPDTPGEFDAIPQVLAALKGAGVGHVMVPALGPGVQGSGALNVQLGDMVHNANDPGANTFSFFTPNIKWMKDGVHPANAPDMMNEATKALVQAAPSSPDTTGGIEEIPAANRPYMQPPFGTEGTNQLAPVPRYDLQYPTIGVPPGGYQRTAGMPGPPGSDPDAGKMVHWQGMDIPMADAKRMIRMTEPGPQGYNAAFGSKTGLPSGYQLDQNNFPIWSGNPVGSMYGGAFEGKLSHAAGMYQFERDTWASAVGALKQQGININDFSPGSQETVASHLLEQSGFGPWAPWNSNLRAMLAQYKQTGQVPSGIDPGGATAAGVTGPYMSGDPVPGTGYAVGGAASVVPYMPPTENLLVPGGRIVSSTTPMGTSGGTTNGSGGQQPFKPNLPPVDLSDQTGNLFDDPRYRQMMMLQILGAQMRGVKFQPIDYDPRLANQPMPYRAPYNTGLGLSVGPTSEVIPRINFGDVIPPFKQP